jgi:glyoxylate/hydroxypyruvate reductase A
MNITFCCTDTKAEPWLQGLQAALPGAAVSVWQPGAPAADYAVVWAPPQQFLDEQTGVKALFNIGAGVDALLKLRLPPTALVVRLDDAGMAVQMAEYVCHAVIRHFREFDDYEKAMRAGQWAFRKPRLRQDFPVGRDWAWACWASAWPGRWRSSISRSMAGAARPRPSTVCALSVAQPA